MSARRAGLLAAIALGALTAGAVHASHPLYGPVLTIDPDSLKRLYDERRGPLPVDLRPPAEYGRSHLPGARSVPLTELAARAGEIPPTAVVVLYCACPPNDVFRAYHLLKSRDYPRVFVLEEGLTGWAGRGYPLER